MTSLAKEQEEQRHWKLRPKWRRVKWFDRLVANEFLPFGEQRAWQERALRRLIRFAAENVPYYRDVFARLGLRAADVGTPDDVPKLPLLTKVDVYEHAAALQARSLPRGEKRWGHTLSSGTTGRPTRVLQSDASMRMFSILRQRENRWFRLNPSLTFATFRIPSQLPTVRGGRLLEDGATYLLPSWRYVGGYFETGPYLCFNITNPIEEQIAWLKKNRPGYLMTYSESLEHLAFACDGRSPVDSLRALLAISEQLTESMRWRIEGTFGIPIHQNYGLNEIGLVAVRCAAGRYHVHTEHCLVEIVGEDGQPCAPGEAGRIVVTGFRNFLMPLIRYDTDDMAEVVEGPCPCGRTLPSFGAIAGRYSRIAFLPRGTLGYVGAVREALEAMPPELARGLRQFQIHQFGDNTFELRLLTAGKMPTEFGERLQQAWQAAVGERQLPLKIVAVDHIARSPGGKFQDFTSDFFPAPDDDAAPPAAPEQT
jgi:phenylacetate-CoA ligase